jgi:hypothetical protein
LSRAKRIRIFIVLFVVGLTLSGLAAIPTHWEALMLQQLFGSASRLSNFLPEISIWFDRIYDAVQNGYGQYPFLAYGTDWLAFGHIAIAIVFVGPLRDPVKNIWVIEFGMIACILVIPWALIFSVVRGIPFFLDVDRYVFWNIWNHTALACAQGYSPDGGNSFLALRFAL